MNTLESLEAFLAELRKHDWYYQYSDDHSVWKRGHTAQRRLEESAKRNPIHAQALGIWNTFTNSAVEYGARVIQREDALNNLKTQLLITQE